MLNGNKRKSEKRALVYDKAARVMNKIGKQERAARRQELKVQEEFALLRG